jgi:hypothetical protein
VQNKHVNSKTNIIQTQEERTMSIKETVGLQLSLLIVAIKVIKAIE